jgi:hypothetical protein
VLLIHAGVQQFLIMKQLMENLIIELQNLKRKQNFSDLMEPAPEISYPQQTDSNLSEKLKNLENVRDPVMEQELANFIETLPTQNTTPLSFSDESVFGNPWNNNSRYDSPF